MKRDYINKLTDAYTFVCACGHAADLHAHDNGHSHPGDATTGACACVLSVSEAALISQAVTIAQQRQTIDALSAALEQVRDESRPCDGGAAMRHLGACYIVSVSALEKARGGD